MEERRKYKRHNVEGVEGTLRKPVEIGMLNISVGGAKIESRKRLEIGNEYSFTLAEGDEKLTLRGEIQWSAIKRSATTPEGAYVPIYHAGMKFSGVKTEDTEVAQFIKNHWSAREQRSTGIRYTFSSPKNAIFEYSLRFTARNLGKGGMLIELGEPLTPGELPVEVDLPGGHTIKCSGRVVSCLGLEERNFEVYQIGIEFLDMPDESMKALEDFISTLE